MQHPNRPSKPALKRSSVTASRTALNARVATTIRLTFLTVISFISAPTAVADIEVVCRHLLDESRQRRYFGFAPLEYSPCAVAYCTTDAAQTAPHHGRARSGLLVVRVCSRWKTPSSMTARVSADAMLKEEKPVISCQ